MKKIVLGALALLSLSTFADEVCSLDVRLISGTNEIKNRDCRRMADSVRTAASILPFSTVVGVDHKKNSANVFENCKKMKKAGATLVTLEQSYLLFYYEDLRNIDCSAELKKLNLSRDELRSIVD